MSLLPSFFSFQFFLFLFSFLFFFAFLPYTASNCQASFTVLRMTCVLVCSM